MDIAALFGALIPVFFVLFLGYCAGKTHAFDSDQAAGLSKLALSFALPSSLFVGMSMLPRELLASQTKLAFCLIVVHVGVLLAAHAILHWGFKVDAARSLVFSLTLATSATPVFGVAVLSPLLGSTSIGAVGLVALAINCAVPLAVILFEMNAAIQVPSSSNSISNAHKKNPALSGLLSGLRSPLLWAPILGCAVALSPYGADISGGFDLLQFPAGNYGDIACRQIPIIRIRIGIDSFDLYAVIGRDHSCNSVSDPMSLSRSPKRGR
jgi:malonate transporter